MPKFNATAAELLIIEKIVYRAQLLGIYESYEGAMAIKDIDACHSNWCPLRLADLLAADDWNFAHDIQGIRDNLDPYTGKMLLPFLPRFYVENVGWAYPNKANPSDGWSTNPPDGWGLTPTIKADGWGTSF
jgi:hypothetical protein